MRIIKLNAIDSTNTFIKQICSVDLIEDYTIVIADYQTNGRGQMGTVWESKKNRNLMFSMFKALPSMNLNDQFYISIVATLAVYNVLKELSIPKLSIKWPNDILSEDKKICGVLIENIVKQDKIKSTIIGIGLNVNQTEFSNLPYASSLKNITGQIYNVKELMHLISDKMKHYFPILEENNLQDLKEEYESYLFRRNKPSTFKDEHGNMFSGFIKTVSKAGKLQVLMEDQELREFNLKEISLLY